MRPSHTLPSGRQTARRRLTLRTLGATAATVLFALATLGAAAGDANATGTSAPTAFVPAPLYDAATAEPNRIFDVIVQGRGAIKSSDVATVVRYDTSFDRKLRTFTSVSGVSVRITGEELLKLARRGSIDAITPNAPVQLDSYTNKQKWPYTIGAPKAWPTSATLSTLKVPAIAIVDSGVDATRPDLAGRVREQVSIGVTGLNTPGDGRGHGTFVASIAAGAASEHAGVAPTAPLVSIDVVNDAGVCMTSNVIAAADWILANKDRLGIRVANFSLHASNPSTFMFDPLNKAVERLWFSGVVVVAASGNYGHLGRGVPHAPGNDPFVITVGASDIEGSVGTTDDFEAPWSAYGYTLDGFSKPEIGAPGRYMIGAVPPTATLALERPDRVVSPGYMQLSGTSFAAPIVSGSAAMLLAKRPHLTPDQVKGALMLTARPTPSAAPNAFGVGEVNLAKAIDVADPPNPNLALNRFLVSDPAGSPLPVFDAASWTSAAQNDASWISASWTSASWTSASWTSASWTSASWTSASWTSASWTSASWTSASWTSASWTSQSLSDASWLTSAETDSSADGGYFVTSEELIAAELEMTVDLNGDGVIGRPASSDTSLSSDTSVTADTSVSTDTSGGDSSGSGTSGGDSSGSGSSGGDSSGSGSSGGDSSGSGSSGSGDSDTSLSLNTGLISGL